MLPVTHQRKPKAGLGVGKLQADDESYIPSPWDTTHCTRRRIRTYTQQGVYALITQHIHQLQSIFSRESSHTEQQQQQQEPMACDRQNPAVQHARTHVSIKVTPIP